MEQRCAQMGIDAHCITHCTGGWISRQRAAALKARRDLLFVCKARAVLTERALAALMGVCVCVCARARSHVCSQALSPGSTRLLIRAHSHNHTHTHTHIHVRISYIGKGTLSLSHSHTHTIHREKGLSLALSLSLSLSLILISYTHSLILISYTAGGHISQHRRFSVSQRTYKECLRFLKIQFLVVYLKIQFLVVYVSQCMYKECFCLRYKKIFKNINKKTRSVSVSGTLMRPVCRKIPLRV